MDIPHIFILRTSRDSHSEKLLFGMLLAHPLEKSHNFIIVFFLFVHYLQFSVNNINTPVFSDKWRVTNNYYLRKPLLMGIYLLQIHTLSE